MKTNSAELHKIHGLLTGLGETELASSVRQSELSHLLFEGLTNPKTYVNALRSKQGWLTLIGFTSVALGLGFLDVDKAGAAGHGGIHSGKSRDSQIGGLDSDGTVMTSVQDLGIQRPEGFGLGLQIWEDGHIIVGDVNNVGLRDQEKPVDQIADVTVADHYGLADLSGVEQIVGDTATEQAVAQHVASEMGVDADGAKVMTIKLASTGIDENRFQDWRDNDAKVFIFQTASGHTFMVGESMNGQFIGTDDGFVSKQAAIVPVMQGDIIHSDDGSQTVNFHAMIPESEELGPVMFRQKLNPDGTAVVSLIDPDSGLALECNILTDKNANLQMTPEALVLSPEFIAFQDNINVNGAEYKLGDDGILRDENDKPIKGFSVDPKTGEVTITVNGVPVVIESSKVHINETGGITVDGFGFDPSTGNFIEKFNIETWAGTDQSRLNFVNALDALGYPRDNVTCDAEGACFDLDGNVIARNGVFLLQFAKDAAIEYGNPKSTIYGPKKGNVAPGTQTGDVTTFVTVPLLRGAREMNKLESLGFDLGEGNEGVFKTYMLSEEDKSWAIEYFRDHKDPNAPRYFIFENNNNDIIIVPVS